MASVVLPGSARWAASQCCRCRKTSEMFQVLYLSRSPGQLVVLFCRGGQVVTRSGSVAAARQHQAVQAALGGAVASAKAAQVEAQGFREAAASAAAAAVQQADVVLTVAEQVAGTQQAVAGVQDGAAGRKSGLSSSSRLSLGVQLCAYWSSGLSLQGVHQVVKGRWLTQHCLACFTRIATCCIWRVILQSTTASHREGPPA